MAFVVAGEAFPEGRLLEENRSSSVPAGSGELTKRSSDGGRFFVASSFFSILGEADGLLACPLKSGSLLNRSSLLGGGVEVRAALLCLGF